MDKFAQRLSNLSPEQRELLELRLKKTGRDNLLPSAEATPAAREEKEVRVSSGGREPGGEMRFSLFYFSSDGLSGSENKYRLLIESAKFADEHGFTAIWTPERHFQQFGGLYPNPSVLNAALAVLTKRIQIRAGSIVLPLHNPIRVAEDWSIIDNLSGGRVGISCASGWHTTDFALAPDAYDNRKELMFRHLTTIQKLWQGEAVRCVGVAGQEVEVTILPRPLQSQLPVWVTSSGSRRTWIAAGEIGAHVLATLGQSIDEVAGHIALYREARARHGHDPQAGQVTLMLHTYLGEDNETVKERVRVPMSDYLRSFIGQHENLTEGLKVDVKQISEADRNALVSVAFDRYFKDGSLLGTPQKCAVLVERLRGIGVDEIACLIDFGLDVETVMTGLKYLNELKELYAPQPAEAKRA